MKGNSATGSAASAASVALWPTLLIVLVLSVVLSACSSLLPQPGQSPVAPLPISLTGDEVAIYALGLIGADYRFGGKNPAAGFDCSGLVSYIYREAAGIKIS